MAVGAGKEKPQPVGKARTAERKSSIDSLANSSSSDDSCEPAVPPSSNAGIADPSTPAASKVNAGKVADAGVERHRPIAGWLWGWSG